MQNIDVGSILTGKFAIIVGIGLAMLVVGIFMKKGRLAESNASVIEKLMLWGGIVVLVIAVLIFMFQRKAIDVPEKDKKELSEFSDSPGCSKPKKGISNFKK